jgi:hypothetical protein
MLQEGITKKGGGGPTGDNQDCFKDIFTCDIRGKAFRAPYYTLARVCSKMLQLFALGRLGSGALKTFATIGITRSSPPAKPC